MSESATDARRGRWPRVHALFLLALALAAALDGTVFRVCDAWYNNPAKPVGGELHQLVLSLAMFGQALGMIMAVTLAALFDRRRLRAPLLALLIGAAALASSVAKGACGRDRPLTSRGATVFRGPAVGVTATRHQSFPSGHTTTAFTLATALAAFYPRGRALFFGLAVGVGVNRAATVAHFPSDIVAGAWLGYALTHALLGWRPLWRLAARARRLGAAARARLTAARSSRGARGWLTAPLVPAAASLALAWAGNHAIPLWDRDEPRFATAAREMQARGDWIVPTFNGELRPDKPILVYWQMLAAYAALGPTPFAARMASGLAGAAAVWLTARLGRRLFGASAGVVAGWVLALSPMFVIESKLCTADATLLAWSTAALYCMWRCAEGTATRRHVVGFWLALALAGLAKGPIAAGIVASTACGFSMLRGEWAWLRRLRWGWGLAALTALCAPWCVAVQHATQGEFLRLALGHHVVARALTTLEHHYGFPGYYLLAILLVMAPWGAFVPWAAWRCRHSWRSDPRAAFLLAWAFGPTLLLECVRTKLVHYGLPTYPALALLLAGAWSGRLGGGNGWRSMAPKWGRDATALGVGAGALAVAAGMWAFPPALRLSWALPAAALGAAVFAAGRLLQAGSGPAAFRIAAAGVGGALLAASLGFLPAFGAARPIHAVADLLAQRRDEPIAFWLYRDPNLVFALRGPFPVLDPLTERPAFHDLRRHAAKLGRFLCPMTEEQRRVLAGDPGLTLEIVASMRLFDPARFGERDFHVVAIRPAALAARPAADGR